MSDDIHQKPFFISYHKELPIDFAPTVEVAACYMQFEDQILFLKRHPDKPQGDTWGVPAGKLEHEESPREAMVRECFEETGIVLNDKTLKDLGKLYIRYSHVDFIYHMFSQEFEMLPDVNIGLEEHIEFRWSTIEEALKMPLIGGGAETLLYFHEVRKIELF